MGKAARRGRENWSSVPGVARPLGHRNWGRRRPPPPRCVPASAPTTLAVVGAGPRAARRRRPAAYKRRKIGAKDAISTRRSALIVGATVTDAEHVAWTAPPGPSPGAFPVSRPAVVVAAARSEFGVRPSGEEKAAVARLKAGRRGDRGKAATGRSGGKDDRATTAPRSNLRGNGRRATPGRGKRAARWGDAREWTGHRGDAARRCHHEGVRDFRSTSSRRTDARPSRVRRARRRRRGPDGVQGRAPPVGSRCCRANGSN
ncbi:hypothetical protein IscW_ISCW010780 [Ixodes scapularis]|uniref:Uncharacterized protein n=1 Tax=Ixodes scapularis TaxID=6945 RepID=B7Q7B4_IXOSC|nr:hypothetical protein IscW_ISCW010780 [Ixodes scapularis]|eukprot:XP_002403862.1 hypothetical protein IscW_ISCW010780 [Ixodes scapularis]